MWWQMFVVQSNTRGIKRNAWINGISKAISFHVWIPENRSNGKKRKEEEREWVRGEGGGGEGEKRRFVRACTRISVHIEDITTYLACCCVHIDIDICTYIGRVCVCVCACVRASLVTSRYACRMLVLDRRCEARPSNSHFLSRLENNFAMILKVRARISDIAT